MNCLPAPAAVDAARARQEAPPPRGLFQTLPGLSERRASVASLRGPAAAAPEPDYHPAPPFARRTSYEADPARYDDALYGQLETGAQDTQHDPAYPDDPYAYQDGYDEAPRSRPRSAAAAWSTVVVVLALAVVGTGAPSPIAPMSVRPAAASRRSSGPTPARPRSCRRPADAQLPKCRTAWPPATAPRRSCRAKKRRSTSTPSAGARAWCFRR